eukprot:1560887-Amphidinium_carterae.1
MREEAERNEMVCCALKEKRSHHVPGAAPVQTKRLEHGSCDLSTWSSSWRVLGPALRRMTSRNAALRTLLRLFTQSSSCVGISLSLGWDDALQPSYGPYSHVALEEMLDKDEPYVYRFRIPSDRLLCCCIGTGEFHAQCTSMELITHRLLITM